MTKIIYFIALILMICPLFANDFVDANDELYFSSNDGDNLHILDVSSNSLVTLYYDDTIVLKNYDELKRISKENYWNNTNFELIKNVEYKYFDNSFILKEKITTSSESIITEKYNNSAKIVSIDLQTKNYETSIFEKQKQTTFEYDSKNRLAKETVVFFDKSNSSSSSQSKQITEYSYNDFCDEPNTKVYKNGFLESEKTYIDKNSFIQKLFLDEELSIITEYRDNAKIKETYYNRDKIFRVIE